MPHVLKIYQAFIKHYGPKKGESAYYKWLKDKPEIAKKAMKTAKKKGDKITEKLPKIIKIKKTLKLKKN